MYNSSLLWMISEPPMYIQSTLYAQHKQQTPPQSRKTNSIHDSNLSDQNKNGNENGNENENDLHSSPGNFMPMKGHFPLPFSSFLSASDVNDASGISGISDFKSTQHAISIREWKSKRIVVTLFFHIFIGLVLSTLSSPSSLLLSSSTSFISN